MAIINYLNIIIYEQINIKDLYLIFGNDKQKALRLLKEGRSKAKY